MRFVDVNILVYAHRADVPRHDEFLAWLEEARTGSEPLGLSDHVLAGFLRIVTHPKIFREPTDTATALSFVEAVRGAPASLHVGPTERTWPIFAEFVRATEARGNVIPDAMLAAQAVEHGATLVTADRGFARFRGLDALHPLD